MSAVQNDTLKINHCVNRAAPSSIYRDWPASLHWTPVSGYKDSEDSLASSCEEFCISFHVTLHASMRLGSTLSLP